jgi:hypothetical protein
MSSYSPYKGATRPRLALKTQHALSPDFPGIWLDCSFCRRSRVRHEKRNSCAFRDRKRGGHGSDVLPKALPMTPRATLWPSTTAPSRASEKPVPRRHLSREGTIASNQDMSHLGKRTVGFCPPAAMRPDVKWRGSADRISRGPTCYACSGHQIRGFGRKRTPPSIDAGQSPQQTERGLPPLAGPHCLRADRSPRESPFGSFSSSSERMRLQAADR